MIKKINISVRLSHHIDGIWTVRGRSHLWVKVEWDTLWGWGCPSTPIFGPPSSQWKLHPCPLLTAFPPVNSKSGVWCSCCISSCLPCPSVFSPPSLSLYSCLDRGALGNPGDRRWGPQIEDPIVVQREMHCGWICPVLCKSNTLFTWTNTSCGVSPLLPCAAFFP